MILWSIRYQGSPQALEGVPAADILEGVRDGLWEPSDEVLGPDDRDWVSLDHHPVFAQAMADYEPPPPVHHPDETKLDMNPLIDVALVLLIFFMLTTTYEELRKEFNPPDSDQPAPTKSIPDQELKKTSIRVTATMEGDKPVLRVEKEVVAEKDLEKTLKDKKAALGHQNLAMEIEAAVPWRIVVAIQDAAAGAKFDQIIQIRRVRPKGAE